MDIVLWLPFYTKLMTAIALMQFIERGQLNLDADVTKVLLPELEIVEVMEKADENSGAITTKKYERPVSPRYNFLHTSVPC